MNLCEMCAMTFSKLYVQRFLIEFLFIFFLDVMFGIFKRITKIRKLCDSGIFFFFQGVTNQLL